MGIGGAALYSLVLMVDRKLSQLGSCAGRALPWIGRAIIDGAAQHGASLYAMPHALDPEDQISDRKPQPKPSEWQGGTMTAPVIRPSNINAPSHAQ
jgi:hypothetical protein